MKFLTPGEFLYQGFLLMGWIFLASGLVGRAQEVQETERVVVIEVPVQVIRDGEPVSGLSKDHFVLTDNGRKQELLQVEEILWQSSSASEGKVVSGNVRASDRRHYLLLFDLYFSTIQTLRKATASALELVEKGLHPEDVVSVALFRPEDGIIVFTGFTNDRARVAQALQQLNDMTFRKHKRGIENQLKQQNLDKFDPLLLATTQEDASLPGILFQPRLEAARMAINDRGGTLGGLKLLRKELAKMAHMVKVGIPNGIGDGALRMSYSQALLANAFRDIEGQKYMVLLSQGFPNELLIDDAYGAMIRSHQESMFKVFRQTDWAVHTIDIKGLRPGGANVSQDGLFQMAADTGGKFYKNYNDPGEAFEKLVSNTSVVYRLTFSPDDLENDGSYHRIKVKLRDVPFGVRVQSARSGYFAPNPEDLAEDFSSAEKAAMILGEGVRDDLETRILAHPIATKKGQTQVAVLLECEGEALLRKHSAPELELEAYVYVLNKDRDIVDFSAQTFSLEIGKNRFMLERSPRIFANIEVPPGTYELRYLLINTSTQLLSLGTETLDAPTLDKDVPIFLPPLFPRTFDQAMLVNLRAERFIFEEQAYPFVAGEYLYIPRLVPTLPSKNKQLVVLTLLGTSKGKWDFGFAIKDASGLQLDIGDLKTQKRSEIREGNTFKVLGLLDLKGYSDGSYWLQVTAVDQKTGASLVQTAPFRIGEPGVY